MTLMPEEGIQETPLDVAAFDLLRDVITCLRNSGDGKSDARDPMTACKEALRAAIAEERERIAQPFDCDSWLDLIRQGVLPNGVIRPREIATAIREGKP